MRLFGDAISGRSAKVAGIFAMSIAALAGLNASRIQPFLNAPSASHSHPFAPLIKDLGLVVVDCRQTLKVPFTLPADEKTVRLTPVSVEVAKSCCTAFSISENWRASPGGEMTVQIPNEEGRFSWSAFVWTSDRTLPPFEFVVRAEVTPRISLSGLPTDTIYVGSGTRAVVEGMVQLVHSAGLPPEPPFVDAIDCANVQIGHRLTTVQLSPDHFRSTFPLQISVKADSEDCTRTVLVSVRTNDKRAKPVERRVVVHTRPKLIATPSALVWKGDDSSVKEIRIRGEKPIRAERVTADGGGKITGWRQGGSPSELVISVARDPLNRGLFGQVKVKTDSGVVSIPLFASQEGQ